MEKGRDSQRAHLVQVYAGHLVDVGDSVWCYGSDAVGHSVGRGGLATGVEHKLRAVEEHTVDHLERRCAAIGYGVFQRAVIVHNGGPAGLDGLQILGEYHFFEPCHAFNGIQPDSVYIIADGVGAVGQRRVRRHGVKRDAAVFILGVECAFGIVKIGGVAVLDGEFG